MTTSPRPAAAPAPEPRMAVVPDGASGRRFDAVLA
jgi:hypothetical protein